MQHGEVDLVMTGTDRVAANGDVCNKIGTYLKALAAKDNDVPFYVCLPSPTIDWRIDDGVRDIPIEERDGREVTHLDALLEGGTVAPARVVSNGSSVANPAFDVRRRLVHVQTYYSACAYVSCRIGGDANDGCGCAASSERR